MVGKTAPITTANRQRFNRIKDMGCIPCMIVGREGVPATIQHITDCGRRMPDEHNHTYGACEYHHLGIIPERYRGNYDYISNRFGPSLARNKRAYIMRFGTESQLLQVQDALLREYDRSEREQSFLPDFEVMRLAQLLHQEIVQGVAPNEDQMAKIAKQVAL